MVIAMSDLVLVDAEKLTSYLSCVLEAVDMPHDEAGIVADCMVDAELSGISSHGVTRTKMYVDAIIAGGIKPAFQYDIVAEAPASAVIDVHGSHGISAAYHAMKMAIEKARTTGIAMVNVRDSNHCGETGYFARMAAEEGMIGIVTSNAPKNMAPWGSAEKYLGTNPLAIAIPTGDTPFSLDMATSTVARGKVILANKKGEKIPLGWAIDEQGNPTTDPAAALLGSVVPFGGAKGSGIAMVIDIICGVMSGSGFGHYMYDATKYPDRSNHTGHSCVAIDISKFINYEDFIKTMKVYCQDLSALKAAPGFDKVIMPGVKEADSRREMHKNGIPLPAAVYDELKGFAEKYKLPFEIRR